MKRFLDIIFSFLALILFSPLFLIIALYIKCSSRGTVFYRGVRTGLYGKPFRIFKFRTMVLNAENKGGPSTSLNDPRFIRGGKFLRKYKLDELPQLFNILGGEMSLVGPRPQVKSYTDLYNDEEKAILSVRPGITDYASIEFANLDKILGDDAVDKKYLEEIEPKKNKLRMKYIKEQSLITDFKIIIKTIIRLLLEVLKNR